MKLRRNHPIVAAGRLRRESSHESEGSALVIVLASLAFMTALALAFVASVGIEVKSSKRYADGITVQLLANSSYALVQSQIKEATKGYDGSSTLAWASQPGMIRTYNDRGEMGTYYRLYSWDALTVTDSGTFNPGDEVAEMAQWNSKKALFTDLNEPVRAGGEEYYPVVDANEAVLKDNVKNTANTISIAGKTYDANGDLRWDIEGFSVAPLPASDSTNLVPMPVKWLYVLANGDIKAAVTVVGNDRQVRVADASPQNPIVGRIAFWTDDDTSKININTASEGVYWDTPRVKSKQDDVFKINQPVGGEYQRYPGHPAMTSLSTVIKYPTGWTPGTPIPTFTGGSASAVSFTLCSSAQWTDYNWAQKIYNISPRIGTGGSFAGAVQTAMLASSTQTVPLVNLDADRLYTSVDELAFKPDRTSNNVELANLGILDKGMLERSNFFLTASSRAPDVNLFNEPRVCIWPIHNTTSPDTFRTAFDRLIARCSTFGGYTYFFERLNPNSPTVDLTLNRNTNLLAYLRNLAGEEIPGFGGRFSSKYPMDRDQILTQIFDYIRSTNLRDAGLVHKTNELNSTSYTKGDNTGAWKNYQAPTRGTNGQGQVVPVVDSGTRGFGRFVTLEGASVLFIGQVDGDGPLCPMDVNQQPTPPYPTQTNTQTDPVTGRPLPYWSPGSAGPPVVPASLQVDKVLPGKMRIQGMFLPQFFCPSVGANWMRSNFKWSVDLADLKLNGAGLNFPSNLSGSVPKIYNLNQWPVDETGFGDQLGLIYPVQSAGVNLVSEALDVSKTGLNSLSGKVTVKIFASDSTLLQTIVLNFDSSPTFTAPALAWDYVANKQAYSNAFDDPLLHYLNYRSFIASTGRYNPVNPLVPTPVQGGRITAGTRTRRAGGFIMAGDSIRSVRVKSGDARLVAAQENPPETLFEVNPTADNLMGAHGFFTGYGHAYYAAGTGKLVKDLAYSQSGIATVNQNTTTDGSQNIFFDQGFGFGSSGPLNGVEAGSGSAIVGTIIGDWDNGPFAIRDGPYINKADEGDSGGGTTSSDLKEPYFWKVKAQAGGIVNPSLFTPNRMVPSAVTFGSLPTGVKSNKPWQTLLFRPMPGHPGSGLPQSDPVGPPYTTPPDHLLLDLFTMPVVEPYAISEPLSTAGRINMNYQIVPFTFIKRETGIRALLKAEKVIAIRDNQVGVYKSNKYTSAPNPIQASIRLEVNPEETLKGFEKRFQANDLFRSASEICDLHIVPEDPDSVKDTQADMEEYWSTHRLTGDNSKERIYATLYPRLTTKSNTFTIYTRVQSLKKVGAEADLWTEGMDLITGQYRGCQTVERFVDPNQAGIPDYAAGNATPISNFYKMRVLATKQFGP